MIDPQIATERNHLIFFQSFAQKQKLKRHISTVHQKKKCITCDAIFTVHEGIKPFKCTTCGNSFAQKQTLKRHLSAVHQKKKCITCNAIFTRKIHLNTHIASVHKGNKPLNVHITIVHEEKKHF